MIYLAGGPPHQDLFDLKMDAPKEIRGEFKPISTSVPGIEIGEHMPRLAQMMEKFTIIRSLHGGPDQHASDLCMSGYPIRGGVRQSGHPSLGSVISKVQGPVDLAVAHLSSGSASRPEMPLTAIRGSPDSSVRITRPSGPRARAWTICGSA